MPAADTQQRAELRLAFLRHLPRRIDVIAQRARRFLRDGWDINGLSVLHEDVQRLSGVAGRYGEVAASERLTVLEGVLAESLARQVLPDAEADAQLQQLIDDLAPAPLAPHEQGVEAPRVPHSTSDRSEVAPPRYWRRWAGDAPPPAAQTRDAVDHAAADVTAFEPDADTTPDPGRPRDPAPEPAARPEPAPEPVRILRSVPTTPLPPPSPAAPRALTPVPPPMPPAGIGTRRRVYHLSDGNRVSVELDQRLETLGYELELLDNGDELKELLGAVAPDAVLVDAGFIEEIESIGAVLQHTRERSGARIALVAISAEDSMQSRLAARRAGANALLLRPQGASEVLGKLDELLNAARDETYRVLIVEDDRSQALFAESILRNAGMEARVVTDAFEVLDAMAGFKPDMVLMDLYMPQCDGTELTALIREREEFLHTPIVFLSGESDQDKHFEALSVGGDDFLSKPIRPKHLIASVSNRVQRARAVRARAALRDPVDPDTGLYHRSYLLDRVNESIDQGNGGDRSGGVLFIEIDNVPDLRERLGLSNVETLLRDLSRYVVRHIGEGMLASRYGDACFVVFDGAGEGASLETQARYLRDRVNGHSFIVSGQPIRLRAAVGVTAFEHAFADAGAALNAAERACRQARLTDVGVRRFEPPRRAEQEQNDALTATLRRAIDGDALELLYQPIVALQGGEDAQYQTLVRMRDEAGRIHAAAQIVPLARAAGLLPALDRWVLGHALQVIDERRSELRPVKLFVSQSAASLAEAGHGDWLANQIGARKLAGDSLIIELVARDVADRLQETLAFCTALVAHGVRFCLSQYRAVPDIDGVLELLPVDFLKLDGRYFEPNAPAGTRDEIRLIVERSHRRGLSVIAPRVEDAQSAAQLWMSGVDYIQGNLVQLAGRELEFDFQSAVL
ncbi:EAL domain-containing protein [Chiayiivirga flava]|uniref:Diguanylate cyclase (GGDEF)-like protein n=1 Tax=Chiayiivirga flava TaxID=659595 RepID=A0A7W8D590_9GAMM|nr:EAL domain-containing protein [Chiayiivirga flava]MBB5208154.1 diguanylate cyclase (GGDEF)-like protein [Chiayiivirga flava]